MRKLTLIIIASFAVLVIHACNNGSKSTKADTDSAAGIKIDTAASSAEPSPVYAPDTAQNVHPEELKPTVSAADIKFVSSITSSGLNEINNGKMAQQKSANARVKNFATMLVNDQTGFGDELATIAKNKSITLPALPGMAEMHQANQLAMKSGSDFDKAYVDAMIKDETAMIAAYDKGSKNCKDPELKAFALRAVPKLKMHLDSAKAVRNGIQ